MNGPARISPSWALLTVVVIKRLTPNAELNASVTDWNEFAVADRYALPAAPGVGS
jgi:hypothetical protein